MKAKKKKVLFITRLIATLIGISVLGVFACDEDELDGEFAKLYEEDTQLSGKLLSLKAQVAQCQ